MKKFIKVLIFIIILVLILGWLYLNPAKIIFTLWGGYQIYSSFFGLALVIVGIYLLYYVVKLLKGCFNLLFNRITLNHALKKYIKRIELSNPIDKEIQLCLIDDIKDLRTLRLVYFLNGLRSKKQYGKALKLIKKKENKPNLKNILNYVKVEILLAEGLKQEAVEVCKVFLNNNKNSTWTFLKLFNITLSDSDNSNLEYLNNFLLHNKINLSSNALEKAYCLINYKLAIQERGTNNEEMYKRLNMLIKRYPQFIPPYVLLTNYLVTSGKKDEAIKILTDSWKYNITYENSILVDNIFTIENKQHLINEAKSLLKNSRYKDKDKPRLLLSIIYANYGEYININDVLIKVNDTNNVLYKLTTLYILLKEHNIKEDEVVVDSFSHSLPMSWWNEFLNMEYKSQ